MLQQWLLYEVIEDILPFVLNTKWPLSDIWLLSYEAYTLRCVLIFDPHFTVSLLPSSSSSSTALRSAWEVVDCCPTYSTFTVELLFSLSFSSTAFRSALKMVDSCPTQSTLVLLFSSSLHFLQCRHNVKHSFLLFSLFLYLIQSLLLLLCYGAGLDILLFLSLLWLLSGFWNYGDGLWKIVITLFVEL